MRFWDSSALIPLLVGQPASEKIAHLLRLDPEVVFWWATPVECMSALARLHREEKLQASGLVAVAVLKTLYPDFGTVHLNPGEGGGAQGRPTSRDISYR